MVRCSLIVFALLPLSFGCPSSAPPVAEQPLVEQAPAPDLSAKSGRYTGSYTCPQGETGLTLALDIAADGATAATFEFFSIASTNYETKGSFKMRGQLSEGGAFTLESGEEDWIEQPEGFTTVDLDGRLDFDTDKITGTIVQPECSTFEVVRTPLGVGVD